MTTSPVKAEIRKIKKGGGLDSPIQCMFNPKEYSFKKSNTWTDKKPTGKDVPEFQFGGGEPASLTLQLLFDTFESGKDVRREHTDRLWELMMIDPELTDMTTEKGRPPLVRFIWGKTWSFDAAITSISQKFTLFSEAGTPLRAVLDVTFLQVMDAKLYQPQNPTSGGQGTGRQWTVKEGDSLASIAYAEYGDSTRWRAIAEANRLVQVRQLRVGSTLEIPSLV